MEISKIKTGDVFSETQFYKHVKTVGDKAEFVTDGGEPLVLSRQYVEKLLTPASHYNTIEKVTRTEMAEKFIQASAVALEVSYNKQVKPEDVVKELLESINNSTPKELPVKLKKTVNKTIDGVERVMTGRHYGGKDEFGRVHFIDMKLDRDATKTYDSRQRLVDPRTLNWMILRGVRYEIK